VSVSAQNAEPSDPTASLDVTWNARAQSAVDPDPSDMEIYNANDGQKFVVVRASITNTGDTDLELRARFLKFESNGVEHDRQALFGSGYTLGGVTLKPDATHSGWTVFSVPEDTTEGQLVVDQEVYYDDRVAVSFTHDQSMAINMSAG